MSNPTPDHFQLTFNLGTSVKVQIYGLNGQLIKSLDNYSSSQRIDVSNFKNGLYLIKITDQKISTTKKLIVK
jgi:type IX secretion system substrate protein